MTTYWVLFLYPLIGIVAHSHLPIAYTRSAWWMLMSIWILAIGFRIGIACDWSEYLMLFKCVRDHGTTKGINLLCDSYNSWEPGYIMINWASAKMGLGIYGVNVASGAFIVFGLSAFCRKMPSPWLAWLVATPYLLTVVSMGFTRQAVALGFFCWALSYLLEKRYVPFVLLILIGSMFHKSAIFLLSFGVLPWLTIHPMRTLIILIILLVPMASLMIDYSISYLFNRSHFSAGAFERALMNALPAGLLLLLHKRWKSFYGDSSIGVWLAYGSIGSILLVWFASTAIDRVGIYLLPIQVYVWSRLPFLPLISDRGLSQLMTGSIVCLYGLTHFVWLNFANHSHCYVPYRNLLLDLLHFSS